MQGNLCDACCMCLWFSVALGSDGAQFSAECASAAAPRRSQLLISFAGPVRKGKAGHARPAHDLTVVLPPDFLVAAQLKPLSVI